MLMVLIVANLDDFDNSFAHQNLTRFRLDNMYAAECAARRLLLPLVNLKEAIFEHCVYEYHTFSSLIDLCGDLAEATS
ncbi:hypothetical protein CU098_013583 [Rhizopus stolonifer]|uniref:Uncharacterized protein n=1 Tax=Rhizopus stolonifer TaxID=4846 RepID=A0A367KVJ0_RHIST|nr:hypothetical protein CU098_013583 [Rhizopus stolonifer]